MHTCNFVKKFENDGKGFKKEMYIFHLLRFYQFGLFI